MNHLCTFSACAFDPPAGVSVAEVQEQGKRSAADAICALEDCYRLISHQFSANEADRFEVVMKQIHPSFPLPLRANKQPVVKLISDEVQKQAEDHNQAAFFSTQQQLLFRGPRGIGKGQHRQGPAPKKKIGKGQPWRRGANKTAGDQPPFQHDKGAVDSDAVRQTTPAKDRRQTTPHNKKVGGPRGGALKKE